MILCIHKFNDFAFKLVLNSMVKSCKTVYFNIIYKPPKTFYEQQITMNLVDDHDVFELPMAFLFFPDTLYRRTFLKRIVSNCLLSALKSFYSAV